MENVAICLFGISYLENYQHWIIKENVSIDYRDSLDNYRNTLLKDLTNYKVYISTYANSLINQILEDYKVEKSFISVAPILSGLNNEAIRQRNLMINSFKNIPVHEWYIFTRFDLYFNFNLSDLSPRKDKINVLAKLEQNHLIDDNFYIVHRDKIDYFYHCMSTININSLNRHYINFFGFEHVHFLTDESGKLVAHLKSYQILRK